VYSNRVVLYLAIFMIIVILGPLKIIKNIFLRNHILSNES